MSVGNKIKALRLQRRMTQNELAEGIISRGMLSRIENGNANPSMASLTALAKRLDISPSFLLEAGDDLRPAARALFGKKLYAAYKAGDRSECLSLLLSSPFSEEEEFVSAYIHTTFHAAIEEFDLGNFQVADDLLSTAERLLPRSIFPVPNVTESNILLIRSIMQNIEDPSEAIRNIEAVPDISFPLALFLFLLKLLQEKRTQECSLFLEFGLLPAEYRTYIEAQLYLTDYKLIDALLTMKGLVAKKECPFFLAMLCYTSMENCCKLCEDFKGAYENRLAWQTLLSKIKRT